MANASEPINNNWKSSRRQKYLAIFLGTLVVIAFVLDYFGTRVKIEDLAKNWECTQISIGPAKNSVTHYKFTNNGRFLWSVYMPNMHGNMHITGDYNINKNEITMVNIFTQLPGPLGRDGPTQSERTMRGKISQLKKDKLDFSFITTAPNININNEHPVEQQCRSQS